MGDEAAVPTLTHVLKKAVVLLLKALMTKLPLMHMRANCCLGNYIPCLGITVSFFEEKPLTYKDVFKKAFFLNCGLSLN